MPIKPVLVLQPEELKGTTISLCKEMLDLRVTIKQRQESYARFDKPSKSKNGEVLKDAAGNPIPFIPSNLRDKCPIKASAISTNDPEMESIMEETAKLHDEYVKKMASQAKKVAALEITIRQKKLRTVVYKLLDKIALAKIIYAEMFSEPPAGAMQQDRAALTKLTVYSVLKNLPDANAVVLEMATGAALAAEYEKQREFNYAALDTLSTPDGDDRFIQPIINVMLTELPILTINLFKQDDKKENERKLNALLKQEFTNQDQLEANDAVQDAMDEVDAANPSEKLEKYIDKRVSKLIEKNTAQIKRSLKKNSSAGAKISAPRPTKSGQESKKNSEANAAAKKRKSKQQQGNSSKDKQAASSKKTKKDKADAPKANSTRTPKSNQGSAGGSKGGGKQKGAARR
jgi:hypothetical protein